MFRLSLTPPLGDPRRSLVLTSENSRRDKKALLLSETLSDFVEFRLTPGTFTGLVRVSVKNQFSNSKDYDGRVFS